ncbi:hypothetical protein [Escherichia coli]|uniref:hypothetical protein n=1 Tax=Escherichia coli TaxID=562 RepID=UPI0032C23E00
MCTSQVLLANIASLYAVYHGPVGLKRIANRIHRLTDILAAGLQQKDDFIFNHCKQIDFTEFVNLNRFIRFRQCFSLFV